MNVCVGAVRFGRRVLTSCWEAVLDVLSVLTSGRSCCGISSSLAAAVMFTAREESRRIRQAICTSLAGLQKAARLSSMLGTAHCRSVRKWIFIQNEISLFDFCLTGLYFRSLQVNVQEGSPDQVYRIVARFASFLCLDRRKFQHETKLKPTTNRQNRLIYFQYFLYYIKNIQTINQINNNTTNWLALLRKVSLNYA